MRDLIKMQTANDGTRTLFESVMSPEVIKALRALTKERPDLVLIGGLGVSFYLKPRLSQDIDIVSLRDADIPAAIIGFKRTRAHAFQHNGTHVEVEFVTPEHTGMPESVIRQIIATSRISNGVRVASPSGLVASKLFRLSMQDKTDIIGLINHEQIDISGFSLPADKIEKYVGLVAEAEQEKNIRDLSLDDEL